MPVLILMKIASYFNTHIDSFLEGVSPEEIHPSHSNVLSKDTLKRPQILVLEDDPSDQYMIKKTVEDFQIQVDLRFFTTVESALLFLHHQNDSAHIFDLMLVDVNLPGDSGVDFIKTIRKNKKYALTPLIVFSSDNSRSTLEMVTKIGASSYIVKNHKPKEMSEMLLQIFTYWCQTSYLCSRIR